jgi:hypothetical protein
MEELFSVAAATKLYNEEPMPAEIIIKFLEMAVELL